MRVLQLIDTLRPGGAERMAVNIANSLSQYIEFSGICCTRKEGALVKDISSNSNLFCLRKKSRFDLFALLRLGQIITRSRITIVHAHGSSVFFAYILKSLGYSFKLVWHDHYGEAEKLDIRSSYLMNFVSKKIDTIISVNQLLKEWAINHLSCEKVVFLKNFVSSLPASNQSLANYIVGRENAFHIIAVGNLRPQKDYDNLINAFEKLPQEFDIYLHIFGEDTESVYSRNILKRIKQSTRAEKIIYEGIDKDILYNLNKFDLGVISSRSEGLSLVFLEFAFAGLPIVATNTGMISEIGGSNVRIVPVNNSQRLSDAISYSYLHHKNVKLKAGILKKIIKKEYSEPAFSQNLLNIYKGL